MTRILICWIGVGVILIARPTFAAPIEPFTDVSDAFIIGLAENAEPRLTFSSLYPSSPMLRNGAVALTEADGTASDVLRQDVVPLAGGRSAVQVIFQSDREGSPPPRIPTNAMKIDEPVPARAVDLTNDFTDRAGRVSVPFRIALMSDADNGGTRSDLIGIGILEANEPRAGQTPFPFLVSGTFANNPNLKDGAIAFTEPGSDQISDLIRMTVVPASATTSRVTVAFTSDLEPGTAITVPMGADKIEESPGMINMNLRNMLKDSAGNPVSLPFDLFFASDPISVPEPSALILFGSGFLGVLGYCWRHCKQAAA